MTAELIARVETLDGVLNWDEIHAIVQALTPRVVSTVAELDALPSGSIVLSSSHTAYTRSGDGEWHSYFSRHTSELMGEPWNVGGPFTVVWQERPVGGTE